MLIFPKGLRFLRANEIPDGPDKQEMLDAIASANIEPGFVLGDSGSDEFSHYAEANVDAPKIWPVFRALCQSLLPEDVLPVIGEKDDEELHTGQYVNRDELLDFLEQYSFQLANDGFIQLGLGYSTDDRSDEVFLAASKHFQVWTSDPERVRRVMNEFDIPEKEKLQFIDEFPRATVSLKSRDGVMSSDDLIEMIISEIGEYES